MIKVTEEARRVIKIEANGVVFIIPNGAYALKDIMITDTKRKLLDAAKATGHQTNNKENVIQVWVSIDDVGTDNLDAHGGRVELADGTKLRIPSGLIPLMPESIFEGKVEGDVVDWVIPFYNKTLNADVELTCHLKMDQLNYRYRRFGRFEEVLRYVCA